MYTRRSHYYQTVKVIVLFLVMEFVGRSYSYIVFPIYIYILLF